MRELSPVLAKEIVKGQKIAVMGVGSELRSDDGAGMHFIGRLSALLQKDGVLLIAGSTVPENFTGVIRSFGPDKLFIVDAAYMGIAPGEIRVLEAGEISGMSFSTHMLPLSVMLNYLGLEMSCDVILIGIQPKSTEQGFEMCKEVAAGAERLTEIFYEALSR